MKLTFLPTLTDLREMLGERLYVEFVWMWREQEQLGRQQECRAKWADQLPARNAVAWPRPLFAKAKTLEPVLAEAKQAQVALLHPSLQRLLDQRTGADWPEQEAQADAVGRRARSAALRSAAE